MKGVVFTEFLELVETGFGMQVADNVVTKGCPFQTGFTSVGTYDHKDLIAMVGQLSEETGAPAKDLVHTFGKHLFHKFLIGNQDFFASVSTTYELLFNVEHVIHVEVLKLTPDAELPTFRFPPAEEGCFNLEYESKRPFADLAGGLIEACIEHFGESLDVKRTDLQGAPGTHALFHLSPKRCPFPGN
jgi:hypothetical protein